MFVNETIFRRPIQLFALIMRVYIKIAYMYVHEDVFVNKERINDGLQDIIFAWKLKTLAEIKDETIRGVPTDGA